MVSWILVSGWLVAATSAQEAGAFERAQLNARETQACIAFAKRYARGWLGHADPRSGLLPRTVRGDNYWNAQDCAADNFPFLALTAYVTDDHHLKRACEHIFAQEQRLTRRLDSLPDDFSFDTQAFRSAEYQLDRLIFGASEYAKDGLLPMTEWLGPGPWQQRMIGLVRDVWKHAALESAVGLIPSRNEEVNGELLQTMSRLWWMTGDAAFLEWIFRLGDYHLLHERLLDQEKLSLRDHGCEIIGGLSEAYVVAAHENPERREAWRPELHALFEAILEGGTDENGLLHDAFEPATGKRLGGISDGFGYVFDAFLTVAEVDGTARFVEPVRRALGNLHRYRCRDVAGMGGADGHADSIESALNLLNRIPVDSAFAWVGREVEYLFEVQREDGILEGWYGDGNSTRTVLMYALWKTQGVAPAPWREDLRIGAVPGEGGALHLYVQSDWAWSGRLRFDRPRHWDVLHFPLDYPRINQFPEWFTARRHQRYEVRREGGEGGEAALDRSRSQEPGEPLTRLVTGRELWSLPLTLKPGETALLTVIPRPDAVEPLRADGYVRGTPAETSAWQGRVRRALQDLLRISDLMANPVPLQAKAVQNLDHANPGDYRLEEVEFSSSGARHIQALVATPRQASGPLPAVVCIHGHGGTRYSVHDPRSLYRGFAGALAARGFVTIAVNVGQHQIYEDGRTLLGERLFDLLRCVDYLESLPQVDPDRIGCAGLSLGGEMAMWLGALDERIAATVSAGFLTTMDQMEQNHCMCWKLPGLRERVDFADIYALTAPRALQCQNGLQEPASQFCIPLARKAMAEVEQTYADLGAADHVELQVHPEGHVIDLPALLQFFETHLARQ